MSVEFTPEGWVHSIRVGGVSYCGNANPGISWQISWQLHDERWLGGCITLKTAKQLVEHLQKMIPECESAPPYDKAFK